jgi:outer membrane lipoprotein-sorting protein
MTPRRVRQRVERPVAVTLVACCLGGLGCATSRRITATAPTRPLRAATLDEVLAAYDGYCRRIQSLSASGDLDVRDLRRGKAQKVGVRLVTSRGGRLYIKGSVAVVTAVEVVANGENFWFVVPSKKTVWTGAAEASARAETGEAPYYALRPADVTLALLPEPLDPDEADSLVLEGDRDSFSLTLGRLDGGRGRARRRVWLQRETLLPSRTRVYDERGDLVSEVSLSSFKDGLPREVVISRPIDGYLAAFTLDKVEGNVPVPERAFSPRTPEGYQVVEVR